MISKIAICDIIPRNGSSDVGKRYLIYQKAIRQLIHHLILTIKAISSLAWAIYALPLCAVLVIFGATYNPGRRHRVGMEWFGDAVDSDVCLALSRTPP